MVSARYKLVCHNQVSIVSLVTAKLPALVVSPDPVRCRFSPSPCRRIASPTHRIRPATG